MLRPVVTHMRPVLCRCPRVVLTDRFDLPSVTGGRSDHLRTRKALSNIITVIQLKTFCACLAVLESLFLTFSISSTAGRGLLTEVCQDTRSTSPILLSPFSFPFFTLGSTIAPVVSIAHLLRRPLNLLLPHQPNLYLSIFNLIPSQALRALPPRAITLVQTQITLSASI